ncbi:MAG: hypothetical protein ACLGIN_08450 [Candidatus Sericytochromatia bacterium]
MRHSNRLALLGSLSLVPLAGAPALAAPQAAAVVGVATFDPARTAIAVPYEGREPAVEFYKLSDTHYYYELRGARLAHDRVQHHLIGDTMLRYTMANRPATGAVRLSFVLTRPGVPTYHVDRTARQVVILPLGREAVTRAPGLKAPAPAVAVAPVRQTPAEPPRLPVALPLPTPSVAPIAIAPTPGPTPAVTPTPLPAVAAPKLVPKAAPKPAPSVKFVLPQQLTPPTQANVLRTELGRPYLDDFHRRLVMPFNGPAPSYGVKIYEKNPRWVYLDFDQTRIKLEGERFESYTDPVFDGWMLTEHEGKPRLYLKFKVQAPLVAQVYPESGEIWFSVPARPEAP